MRVFYIDLRLVIVHGGGEADGREATVGMLCGGWGGREGCDVRSNPASVEPWRGGWGDEAHSAAGGGTCVFPTTTLDGAAWRMAMPKHMGREAVPCRDGMRWQRKRGAEGSEKESRCTSACTAAVGAHALEDVLAGTPTATATLPAAPGVTTVAAVGGRGVAVVAAVVLAAEVERSGEGRGAGGVEGGSSVEPQLLLTCTLRGGAAWIAGVMHDPRVAALPSA
ncbi:unnamed protein product [Closterium sp. NIES-64]|nr:unnamed protein product [Closterium sp. NIES-64]